MRAYTVQGYDLRFFKGPIRLDHDTYIDTPVPLACAVES